MKESNNTVKLINDLSQAIEEINKADDFDEMKKSVKNKSTIKSYTDKKGKSFAKDTFIGVIKSIEKAEEKINKCAKKGRRGDNKIYENCKGELERIKKKVSKSGNRDTILANKETQEKCKDLIIAIQSKVSEFNGVEKVRKKDTIALLKQLYELQEALKNAPKEGKRVWELFSKFFESPIVKKFMKKDPSISGKIIRELFKTHVKYMYTNDAKYIDGVGKFLNTQWLHYNAPFIPKNFINSKEKRVSRTALGEEVLEAVKGVVDELNAFEEHIIVEVEVESEPEPADSAAGTSAPPPSPRKEDQKEDQDAGSAGGHDALMKAVRRRANSQGSNAATVGATSHRGADPAAPAVAPSASTAKRRKYSVPKTPPPPPPISADKSASPPPTPARPTVSASSTDTPPAPVPRNSKDSAAPAAPVAPPAPPAPPPPTPARPAAAAKSKTPPAPVPRDSKDSAAPAAPVAPPAPPAPAVSTDSAATSGGSITESTLRRVKLTPPPPKEVADSANPPTATEIRKGKNNLRKVTGEQQKAHEEAKRQRKEERRSSLLKEIEGGKRLKSVKDRKLSPEPPVPEGTKKSASNPNNFANALNARIGAIRAAVADDDDGEWNDI